MKSKILEFFKGKSASSDKIQDGESHLSTIENVFDTLSKSRPIFRSEKDFQDALYNEIRLIHKHCERNKKINDIKVDLYWEENGQEMVIQLRHKTKKLSVAVNGELFDLKNHGAQDLGRYDYLKDLESIERLCFQHPTRVGYAILLTNDHLYWQDPVKKNTVDEDFLLFEGNQISGELSWKPEASPGTTKGRETPIYLKNEHKLNWENYSQFGQNHCEFRYLCVRV